MSALVYSTLRGHVLKPSRASLVSQTVSRPPHIFPDGPPGGELRVAPGLKQDRSKKKQKNPVILQK